MNCGDLGAIIGFFDSILMGCFISCFRGRDRDRGSRSISASISTDSNFLHENLVTKDPLGLGFQSEEKETQEVLVDHDLLNDQLRQEAVQLKLCGVITQTPPEIKKLHKRRAFQELNGSDISPKSSQTASNKKSPLNAKSEQENHSEKEKQILNSKENTPATGSSNKDAKLDFLTPAQRSINKRHLTGVNIKSPYPTPLTLKDEMETPLTAFPSSYVATNRTGKRARVRSQFIFPSSNQQLEISSPMSAQQAEKQLDQSSGVRTGEEKKQPEVSGGVRAGEENQLEVSGGVRTGEKKQLKVSSSGRTGEERRPEVSSDGRTGEEETPKTSVASLSEWLKPFGVRNGIPNTTTKYKEDQKVKWHATPFEERLEKVLSEEEKMLPRMQMASRLFELEEE